MIIEVSPEDWIRDDNGCSPIADKWHNAMESYIQTQYPLCIGVDFLTREPCNLISNSWSWLHGNYGYKTSLINVNMEDAHNRTRNDIIHLCRRKRELEYAKCIDWKCWRALTIHVYNKRKEIKFLYIGYNIIKREKTKFLSNVLKS